MANRCNHCLLEAARQSARDRGHDVTLQWAPKPGFPEGVDVFIHPPKDPAADWWAMWLAKFPERCAC